jgi:hypothetical protein
MEALEKRIKYSKLKHNEFLSAKVKKYYKFLEKYN